MYYVESATELQDREYRAREALLSRVLSPSPVFTLHGQDCEERAAVEQFVAGKFMDSYKAEIHEFMPMLLSMRCLNSFSGVVGMRKAEGASLFMEQYLDGPVEKALAEVLIEPVVRRDVVEIGNLVAGRKGPSQFIFLIFTSILHDAGYKWITFTATQSLVNNLTKLGFPMVKLADATADCLPGDAAREWGEYYNTRPQVMAGSLDTAMAIARKRPLFRKAMALYRREIKRLAREISES